MRIYSRPKGSITPFGCQAVAGNTRAKVTELEEVKA